jgi:hypothetical protein
MIELEHHVTIHRSISDVFSYVSRVENLPDWAEVAQSARQSTPGTVEVGTRVEVDLLFNGQRTGAIYEVTRYAESSLFAFRTLDAPFELENVYRFSSEEDSTRINVTSYGEAHGFMRFLESIVAGMLDRQFIADHNRLKELLESDLINIPTTGHDD